MRWMLVLAFLILLAVAGADPGWSHDRLVRDPVCRMKVDPNAAKFKLTVGNETFYFCSQECQTNFTQSPAKYQKLAAELASRKVSFDVSLTTDHPPVAGQPVALTIGIRYASTGQLVTDFESVHTKLLHFLMATSDLAWFEHQHPVLGADGLFHLTWTFPRPGDYRLYADFTPADGDNQVKLLKCHVGGGPARALPLAPDKTRVKQVGDLTVELTVQSEPLCWARPALLTYSFWDAQGKPVTDMQPFIGAPGHLIAMRQKGPEVVHTHVVATPPNATRIPRTTLWLTPEMATEQGPAMTFELEVPGPGLYKVWGQFMHHNRVVTVPFVLSFNDIWMEPMPDAVPAVPDAKAAIQRATIAIDGGYSPSVVSVQEGLPVELTFTRAASDGCGDVVQIPELGLKKTIERKGRTVLRFTPTQAGPVRLTCGMGMYRGMVMVKSATRSSLAQLPGGPR
jgi:YHS domain-containing protein